MEIQPLPVYQQMSMPTHKVSKVELPRWYRSTRSRIAIGLIFNIGIVATLILIPTDKSEIQPQRPPTTPLHFNLIEERYRDVTVAMSIDQVLKILGPEQHNAYFREPEFDEYERLVEAHPDRYPGKREWAKWSDPNDISKWVAVYVCDGKVFKKLKKGL